MQGGKTLAEMSLATGRSISIGGAFEMFLSTVSLGASHASTRKESVLISGQLNLRIGANRQMLYRHVSSKGELRPNGVKRLSHSSTA